VAAKRIEATDKWTVGMDAATLSIKKDTGSVFFPIQQSSSVMGVTGDKISGGQAPVGGKTGDFVRVDLDLFVAAAREALPAGKEKRGLPVQLGPA